MEDTGAEPRLVAELEDYGLIKGDCATATKFYDETEREIVRAVTELARYGVGGPQPARLQDVGRARVRPAAADPRPGAALAQPGAPQGGRGGAREPRGGRLAPQAPAAGARPAADRASERRRDLRALIRDIPDFPKPGIVFKDITPLLLDPDGAGRRRRRHRRLGARRATSTSWSRPRRAASSSGRRSRASSAPVSCPPRKPGKLPAEVVTAEYILEYGIYNNRKSDNEKKLILN